MSFPCLSATRQHAGVQGQPPVASSCAPVSRARLQACGGRLRHGRQLRRWHTLAEQAGIQERLPHANLCQAPRHWRSTPLHDKLNEVDLFRTQSRIVASASLTSYYLRTVTFSHWLDGMTHSQPAGKQIRWATCGSEHAPQLAHQLHASPAHATSAGPGSPVL